MKNDVFEIIDDELVEINNAKVNIYELMDLVGEDTRECLVKELYAFDRVEDVLDRIIEKYEGEEESKLCLEDKLYGGFMAAPELNNMRFEITD